MNKWIKGEKEKKWQTYKKQESKIKLFRIVLKHFVRGL